VGPSWQSGVELGVGVLCLCSTLVVSQVLLALNPPRRRLWDWATWCVGCLLAIAPFVLIERASLAGLLIGPILGTIAWGCIELRAWGNNLIYVRWPAKVRREENFRAYRPKAFDD
jgi:hypothetical protein